MSRGHIIEELRTLAAGSDPPQALPEAEVENIAEAGRAGTPQEALTGAYRFSHQALSNAWNAAIDRRDLPSDAAGTLRLTGSDFFFAYASRVSMLASDAYADAHAEMVRSTERSLAAAVCSVLDGDESAASAIEHPIDGYNVALLGEGKELLRHLPELVRAADSTLMVIDVLEDPWWAWIGRSRRHQCDLGGDLRRLAGECRDGRLGIGRELGGIAGFVQGHRQAAAAFAATTPERKVVAYPEIAIEDLASRDLDAAQEFVAAELGVIRNGDRRSKRLCQTLRAYFAAGDNARATARALGIHHQTVAQRLDAIEQRLGVGIPSRRAELELALRLDEHLRASDDAEADKASPEPGPVSELSRSGRAGGTSPA